MIFIQESALTDLKTKVLKANHRKSRVERAIESTLKPQELRELRELLRDETIVLRSIYEVLIARGVHVSYSSLYSYRQKISAR